MEKTAASKPRFPLWLKLAVLTAFLATVPLGAVGLVLIDINAHAVEVLSHDLQLAVVADLVRSIDEDFGQSQDGLQVVGEIIANASLAENQTIALALAQVSAQENIDHAAVYGAEGSLIDTIREEGLDESIRPPRELSEELRSAAAAEGVATGAVAIHGGEPRALVVVPLRTAQGVTGYVASLVSLRNVQQRVELLAAAYYAGQESTVFVVDRELRLLAHPEPARAARLEPMTGRGLFAEGSGAAQPRGIAQSSVFSAEDGAQMVGSSQLLSERPWIVVAQVPIEVAYASLHQMRLVVLLTLVVAMLLALGLGLWSARRIASPLRRLTKFADHLAKRRFDKTVEVKTRDELSTLGQAMSNAAADLKDSEDKLRLEAAIRSDLGRYLSADLVDKVVRREQDMGLGGERRPVTVLFADVVAFTPLTEKLAPEEVVTILNELFTIMTEIIFRHGGTVDKFIGDCVMALWGAPTPQEDHAARAVEAAEEMLSWLEMGNVTWEKRFGVTIQLAIGIHSGEAVVGNIGSETRMEYTAIGDVINVGARLESIARPLQILVTESTYEAAGPVFAFAELGERRLSGREEPIQLYEVQQ